MKFLIDIELNPEGDAVITPWEFAEHLAAYQFSLNTSFEMSRLAGDPNHELGSSEDYVIYSVESVKIEIVEE